MTKDNAAKAASIAVNHLSYAFQDGSSGLINIVLNLPPGSRTLLVGGTCYSQILIGFLVDTV